MIFNNIINIINTIIISVPCYFDRSVDFSFMIVFPLLNKMFVLALKNCRREGKTMSM